ncbi:MAG: phosphoribosylformylglycinamidine synthase subunit PurQ [candidate division KSB1 bacterium]|nr:phosphoribosylformylglycinamidine synthase subunit PurQ [candidate division KSB1 bacterium]MDZ7275071.1 phosphoribosylformylglycinamidine synthase subunit PurQ [candidate division KSB1 bacterium]MDZ7286481.1 phosphoribosylformylglycinamidine synthase subunit PurQ [candidate division KSB1 bacterium]MDZ7299355.1 phosphoribosylformylglycinamidine synthase subunit PurQ [candidate division KSB1 bacterium]MDZ7306316.1 phosphoribosylformylglycinamidine synthase subunit PurQ [candidate division KSB1
MRFGVVVFPGSNCDHDCYHVLKHVLHQETRFLWHKERDLAGVEAVILPGGFSYGDYLRTGAIARFSPVMEEVIAFARDGGIVIGICNGFQILCEAGLLPGVLLRNAHVRFVSRNVHVRTENAATRFTGPPVPAVLKMPVAHGEGNYFADPQTLARLEQRRQILFRYCSAAGEVTPEANPNGSAAGIAGLMNEAGNVMGLMPHPERAAEAVLGSTDGATIFAALIAAHTA